MADETSLLGKIFVGIVVLEFIGIILALTIGSSGAQFNSAFDGFKFFISSVNATTSNIATSFSSCSFATLSCNAPLQQMPYLPSGIFSGIPNAIVWLGNGIFTFIDLIVLAIWMGINILALVLVMMGLLGFMFAIFLPSIMVSVGPIGYLLSIGYVFIICLAGYKYGHIILDLAGMVIGFVGRFI